MIPFRRWNSAIILLGSALFVAAGVWMMADDAAAMDLHAGMGVPIVLTKVAGLLSVLFFGAGLIGVLAKGFHSRPGFAVTQEGITDNSTLTAAGFVPWGDITGLRTHTFKLAATSTLLVFVSNPEGYIRSSSSPLTRFARWANHKWLGTPVTVTAETLGCSHEELYKMVSAGRSASLA